MKSPLLVSNFTRNSAGAFELASDGFNSAGSGPVDLGLVAAFAGAAFGGSDFSLGSEGGGSGALGSGFTSGGGVGGGTGLACSAGGGGGGACWLSLPPLQAT